MRAELPKARLEVKGAAGRLERAAAEAREGARVAGRAGLVLAKIVGAVGAFALVCVAIGSMDPLPRHDRETMERLRRMQQDLDRMQQSARYLNDAQVRALLEMPRYTLPPELGTERWNETVPPLPHLDLPAVTLPPDSRTTPARRPHHVRETR